MNFVRLNQNSLLTCEIKVYNQINLNYYSNRSVGIKQKRVNFLNSLSLIINPFCEVKHILSESRFVPNSKKTTPPVPIANGKSGVQSLSNKFILCVLFSVEENSKSILRSYSR